MLSHGDGAGLLVVVADLVLARHEGHAHPGQERQARVEEELARALEDVERGGDGHRDVGQRGVDQPQALHHALHLAGRLGIGELQARGGHEDLRQGEHDVREDLPGDVQLRAAFDEHLVVARDDVGERADDEPQRHAPQRGELPAGLLEGRVDDAGEHGDEDHHQRGVDELHLAGLEGERADLLIHPARLHHPGGGLLIEEHPEEGDGGHQEQVDAEDGPHALDGLLGVGLPGAGQPVAPGGALAAVAQGGEEDLQERVGVVPGGRDDDVVAAAEPVDDGGHEHQHAGDAEGHRRAQALERQRDEERGEERAEVDGPVEDGEDLLHQVLVLLGELVADHGGHARLDAARAQGDEEQARVEAGGAVLEKGQARVAHAVQQAQPEDDAVLAQEPVRQVPAEQREEVDPGHEQVEVRLGHRLPCRRVRVGVHQQVVDEEHREDVPHPVEAEPLTGLIADDVGDLRRKAAALRGEGLGHARHLGGGRVGRPGKWPFVPTPRGMPRQSVIARSARAGRGHLGGGRGQGPVAVGARVAGLGQGGGLGPVLPMPGLRAHRAPESEAAGIGGQPAVGGGGDVPHRHVHRRAPLVVGAARTGGPGPQPLAVEAVQVALLGPGAVAADDPQPDALLVGLGVHFLEGQRRVGAQTLATGDPQELARGT
ncbi:hypothetical protein STIAU_4702 [Stigmatella aurantiaca DW4/3-1]|uniref:Uncharacterized protein n=1 Tax=Stigmatella aurantiaca (strain DW4/3-1) TaxID=378806 RepID=Q08PT5_STIAD|nr:hypothetical protein STIAU_4702 [Stigmatella aurantiaca DW4/3-1]